VATLGPEPGPNSSFERGPGPGRVLPIFALGTVLLPGAPLPLHVFEQRYRRMVADLAQREPREFVVLSIKEGDEVLERPTADGHPPAPPVTREVGTVARVTRIQHLPDGRSFLMCTGTERVRLVERTQGEPYPAGRFMALPEDAEADANGELGSLAERTQAALRELFRAIQRALPDDREEQRREVELALASIPNRASELSYFAARVLSTATNEEKQRFLESPGPLARLRAVLPVLLLESRLARTQGAVARAFLN
jgi:uncharacterized protein